MDTQDGAHITGQVPTATGDGEILGRVESETIDHEVPVRQIAGEGEGEGGRGRGGRGRGGEGGGRGRGERERGEGGGRGRGGEGGGRRRVEREGR